MVECPSIPTWLGVVGNTSSKVFMTALQYMCDENFEFVGEETEKTTVCDEHGQWRPSVEECQGKLCSTKEKRQ